ncbi:50S ribosomal protein L29 [Helicobacter bizzozeronii]|uniref:Large ribosomal subunit protein uL29 n=1 Tax=Helicobacter bizzozeronii (strain CIII-1) TaxID=1002804 RepID=F8KT27_HELBC|nr:50S ribosomal protein L29 [Helicobacter bizzozeronii]CCB79969.1 LSU ribosomal protein L29p (L35e) [Helicobacter bizzozeronii CIII-1]
MKFIELQNKNKAELEKLLKDKKLELFELRVKLKTMQLSNPNEIRGVRKDIARISTALSALKAGHGN